VNKLTSALGAIAVMAIAVVFILQFRPASNAQRTDTGPQCAVEVRGSCLTRSSFQAAYRLIRANADPSRLRAMGFGKKVADGLLEAWVLGQDAKRLGINVSDDEVTAEIAAGRAHVSLAANDVRELAYNLGLREDLVREIPVKSPKTKKFDARYAEKQIRYYSMMSPTEFREYQRSEMVAQRVRDIVKSRVRVSENEAFEKFSRDKSTVTLDFARFDRRFFADLVVDTSEKAVDFWADAHKEEIDKAWEPRKAQVLPECRSVSEIFIKVEEAATDEEKAKARAHIDHADARLRRGDDFADVARAVSEGATAARGGGLGCLLRGKVAKPLEEAVMKLTAGKTTDIIATESGFYIVKLDQIAKDADAEKLGRAQAARELYLKMEAERLAAEAAKKVAAAVKGGKSVKDALDAFYADLPKPGAPKADDKKKDDKKKDAKADAKGDPKADKKVDDGEDRAPLTYENHPGRPTPETTLPFNVSNDPIPGIRQAGDLVKIAFGLEKPGDAPPDALPFEAGYLVIQLKEKTPVTKEQWEKNKDFYVGNMRNTKAHDALIAYVKRIGGQLAADAKFTASIVEDKAQKGGDAPPADDDPGE
jgi:peptidyl-prolyl cis-trans isomerase D